MDVSSEFPMHVLHFFFCNCSITELKLAMLAFFFFFFSVKQVILPGKAQGTSFIEQEKVEALVTEQAEVRPEKAKEEKPMEKKQKKEKAEKKGKEKPKAVEGAKRK